MNMDRKHRVASPCVGFRHKVLGAPMKFQSEAEYSRVTVGG